MSFTAKELEDALLSVIDINKKYPDLPVYLNLNWWDVWGRSAYPLCLKTLGGEKGVWIKHEDSYVGEEDGQKETYVILSVVQGGHKRYFRKTGRYDSWDGTEWDGDFTEVVPQEVKVMTWKDKEQ